jgi:hypothetical protein
MDESQERISILNSHITDEIFAAFGFETTGCAKRLLWPVFWLPAQLFARLADGVDQNIANFGLAEAARRLLPRFVDDVKVMGVERIPPHGPLLVASNHPGAYDSVVILANLPRADLKVVVSDVSLLRSLPALDQRLIYTLEGIHGRMTTLRNIIRHLQTGGSVLIFATGFVDPDPAVLPGAEQKLEEWSPSLELALRCVPEAKILPTIVSGVLSPASLHTPLLRFQKEAWKQRKLAEFLQVIQQLVFHRDYGLTPHISFGEPWTAGELADQSLSGDVMPQIIAQAKHLLERHLEVA